MDAFFTMDTFATLDATQAIHETMLKSYIYHSEKPIKRLAEDALNFSEDLKTQCKEIIDSGDPNLLSTLHELLVANEEFMLTNAEYVKKLKEVVEEMLKRKQRQGGSKRRKSTNKRNKRKSTNKGKSTLLRSK
jgi:hypothetical protein